MTVRRDRLALCPVLVGRAEQLGFLDRALLDLTRGTGHIVLLAGDAGIGKSRLVAAARARASEHDLLVLESSCFEPDRTVPYAPIIDLLGAQLAGLQLDEVGLALGPQASVLQHLVPELALRWDLTPTIAADPAQQRHQVFHAVLELLAGLARTRPVLLIFEDLHWCDDATLEFLLYLARRVARLPMMLVLSYRVDEPHSGLRHLLAELDRQRLATELTLAPLSRIDVELMLRATLSLDRPVRAEVLTAMYTLTEGNPFFVEEVLGALAADANPSQTQHDWDRVPLDSLRISRTIQDAVVRRLDRVSPAAQRLVRLAAVAGHQFELSLLEALADQPEPALLQQLAELVSGQLVIEESVERFAFRHALTRQAIYSQLLARERQVLHRAIAEAIERRDPEGTHDNVPQLAYHHYQAGSWPQALFFARRMGERAQKMHAPQAALEHFSHALEAERYLGHPPSPELLRARGQVYEMQGDFPRAQADYDTALAATRSARDRKVEWQLLLDVGFLWLARDLHQAGDFFRQALDLAELLNDPACIAASRNRLGNWHVNMDLPGSGLDLHRRALDSFTVLGDRPGMAQTLDLLAVATYVGGDRRGAMAAFEQAAEQFRTLDDRRGLASVLATLAHLRCASHVYDTLPGAVPASRLALGECHEALRTVRAIGWRSGEAYASCELAACLGTEGNYGPALTAVAEGHAIAEELEHRGWLAVAHATFGMLELDLLDAEAALGHFEHADAQARQGGSVHLVGISAALLALACLLHQEPRRAEAILREVVDPAADITTLTQSLLLAASAEVHLARGEPEIALGLAERLIAWAEMAGGPGIVPRLAKLRGEALAALGQTAAAEAALGAAATAAVDLAARPLLWRIHVSLGKLLQGQGRRAEAEQRYVAARALVEELAATLPDDRGSQFRARALALMPAARPLSASRAVKAAYGGLTARERQIAALIGGGLSNAQIAAKLVVSERTVETHTGHIRDKLGFSSRAQVAAWAIDMRLRHTTE